MISKLSAKYQFCAIRTADTRDGQLTTPGVYTWVVRELSIVCPSFIPALFYFRTWPAEPRLFFGVRIRLGMKFNYLILWVRVKGRG